MPRPNAPELMSLSNRRGNECRMFWPVGRDNPALGRSTGPCVGQCTVFFECYIRFPAHWVFEWIIIQTSTRFSLEIGQCRRGLDALCSRGSPPTYDGMPSATKLTLFQGEMVVERYYGTTKRVSFANSRNCLSVPDFDCRCGIRRDGS